MITRGTAFFSLVAACAAVAACQSSSDGGTDNVGAAGSSPNGGAGSSSVGGVGGVGGSNAQAGSSGAAGKTNGGNAGTAGTGGLAGGAAGSAGRGAGAGGGVATAGNGGTSAVGNGDGGTNDGEAGSAGDKPQEYAYLSTYLSGIFSFSLDPVSGEPSLLDPTPVDRSAQVYALSVDPTQRFLYVADTNHKLDIFKINANHTLPVTPTFSTPIVGAPVTLVLDPAGHFVYVGSRSDDFKVNIDVFKIDPDSGALTSAGDTLKLDGAPGCIGLDPSGQFAYLTSSTAVGILGYTVSPTSGLLTPIQALPFGDTAAVFGGAIAFRPDGKFLYTSGGGVNAFAIGVDGKLEKVEGSPFNTDVASDPTATNIAIEPRGKFLYATQFPQLNQSPRVFGFSIDSGSGKLLAVPGVSAPAAAPYSVGIDPSGRFAYAGEDDGTLSVFALDRSNGSLKEIDSSPIQHGGLQPEIAFVTGQ